jgi:hypothetical protein
MRLNERAKQDLIIIINKLEEQSFDERDISDLLRYLRPQVNKNSLLWEFASFIAHTEERTKGFIHEKLDLTYAKLIHFSKLKFETSQILNIYEISNRLYKTLVDVGLKKYSNVEFKKEAGISKEEALSILRSSYTKQSGVYKLSNIGNAPKVLVIFLTIINTINLHTAVENNKLINELEKSLLLIIKRLNIDVSVKEIISNNREEILVCFMCLIHSHEFELYDKKIGSCVLNLVFIESENIWRLVLGAKIYLGTNYFSWPLMLLDKNVSKFIPELSGIQDQNFKLEGFNAIRTIDGNLIIAKH